MKTAQGAALEATKALEIAQKLDPNDTETTTALVKLYGLRGEWKQALAMLEAGEERTRVVAHIGRPPRRPLAGRLKTLIVPWEQAIAMIDDGRIEDAKSMLALTICDRLRRT